ncbi:uncharacterized protein Dmoj_GI25982 [Drosophila mojavensis]|uniref:HAT C-terminal dimerisation domain-containing protein n=1 Tax=Drosophila mojavensis TaxID=7230 RepID=A0A0Q9X6T1_DROMO|nr:uncharacterized protein Dmoj_GI25982 [Drosophila mojavensis]
MAQVDHLGNLCSSHFDIATAGRIKLHRTKCTSIIKNVLARHFYEDLCSDIGDSKFSLILDESTDISVTKLLGLVIKYFSVPRGEFVSTFLSLVQLEFGNATCIVDGVKNVLLSYKLDIKNLIGIGTDNATVMVVINRSVYTELKKEAPQLILVKCVCHSVQLAVSQEHLQVDRIADIERQYYDINLVKWENINDSSKFWNEVSNYKDSGGNCRFLDLAAVALQMFSLPWSNAEVERVFRQLNLVKSKLRNSMSLNTINSILSIRYGLRRLGKCCYEYKVPPNYLRMIAFFFW